MSDLTELFTWTCPRCGGLTEVRILCGIFHQSFKLDFFCSYVCNFCFVVNFVINSYIRCLQLMIFSESSVLS